MKNHSLKSLLLTMFFVSYVFAQSNPEIEVFQKPNEESIIISIKNISDEQKEINLNIDGKGTCKIIKSPITKLVKSGDEVTFITLTPYKGKKLDYSISYSVKSKPTAQELNTFQKKIDSKTISQATDFSSGLIIFGKDGCPRCNKTLKYLIKNNIDFKYINTSKSIDLNSLMWEMLKEEGAKDNITMPVIVNKGKLTHTHKNLEEFLTKI